MARAIDHPVALRRSHGAAAACIANDTACIAGCDFDDVELPSAESRAANGTSLVPGINFLALRSFGITAGAQWAGSPVWTFGVKASFQLATKSSVADSNCIQPDTDAACLTADTYVAIGFEPATSSIILKFDFEMHGTWFEPVGLKNFAIANPNLNLGVQIYPGGVPKPLKLAFEIELYWKRSGSWPSSLREKKKDGDGKAISPFPDACSDCGVGDLFIFNSAFLYEEKLPVPRFGVSFMLTAISLSDIVNMAADIAARVAELAGQSEPPSRPTFPKELDKFLKEIDFAVSFELSTVDDHPFQRRLYLYGKAGANFAEIGSFYFMVEAEFPLAEDELSTFVADPLSELKAGIKINASVTLPTLAGVELGRAAFYGSVSSTKFEMKSALFINVVGFVIDFEAFINAKDGEFSTGLSAKANLGVLGFVFLHGTLSSTAGLRVTGKANVTIGDVSLNGDVTVRLDNEETFVSVDSALDLGKLGSASLKGNVTSESRLINLDGQASTTRNLRNVFALPLHREFEDMHSPKHTHRRHAISGMPLPLRLLPSPRAMRRVLAIRASVPSRFAQYPKRCSTLVRLPAVLRPPRERLVPRLERHESGAAGLRAERPPSAQPRVASMPTALPRRPKQARAMLIPFYAADARSPPPAPSQIQNNVGETGVPRCPWCRASSCVRCE